ncbi:acyl-CoA dehydrogenase family protein [Micromonospora sp. NPDC047074]|uniref:acyl-CoA dehydrogenase family protein n=1 Tax=Micromonospora sp. NPDC047074 TaxID=3154339 RepID=UPI0033C37370
MVRELRPRTAAGDKAARLAEDASAALAERAYEHDRSATFPVDNLRDLATSGLLGACVPEELGGLGVDTLHDLTVVVNRLGRADAGIAIAVHMQLAREWYFTRRWQREQDAAERDRLATALRQMADGTAITCGATSEAGTDHDHVMAEATPVEGGYLLNGRKIFVTMSAAATDFYIRLRVLTPDGYMFASAHVPRSAPGLTVVPGWDALGMRTSGSNDVVLDDVFVPAEALSPRGQWGVWNAATLQGRTVSNIGLQGAYLGCAEAARDMAVAQIGKKLRAGRSGPSGLVHAVGELDLKLATARATLQSALGVVDEALAGEADAVPAPDGMEMMVAFQCAKTAVTSTAIDVVNTAMTLVGGGTYLSSHPLSRIYRDVRAGPFMQPHAPLEALDFIGNAALGLFSQGVDA